MQAKNENDERAGMQVPAFVTSGIENGRSRLHALEEQAQELIRDLYSKGNKEMESFREKLPVAKIREKLPVEDIVEKARAVESETRVRAEAIVEDVERRLQGLQDGMLALVGVASREQVEALARDLDRVSRRLDKLAKAAKATQAPKAAASVEKDAPKKTKKAPAVRRKTRS
jgi:hypothetical protein